MPDPVAPPTPIVPAAPPVTPAPPSPAPAPETAKPAHEPKGIIPTREPKAKLSAKKALGLEDNVSKLVGQEIKKARDRIRANTPVTAELPAPAAPAPAKKVTAPPAAPEPPVVAAPSAPEAPPAAPAPTPAPDKVTIAGKEYTVAELEAKLKETPGPAPAAAPAPEPPPAPKPPTAEEVQAAEAKFIAETAATLSPALTSEQLDTILAGGDAAVSTLQDLRRQDMATSILAARKGIASALSPIMDQMFAALRPLVEQHQELQKYHIEQQFVAKHPDITPHLGRAKQIAEELNRLYPQQVAKMSPDQFIDEVYRQTDLMLSEEHRRWFPQGNGNWRASAAPPAPSPTPAPAPSPAPVAAAPVAPVRAPAPNVPAGAGGGAAPNWRKSVASSMR